ncbi:MAG: hypothetical protein VW339_08175 [Quisquiliibacterium sp.]
MKKSSLVAAVFLASVATIGLSACSERPQDAPMKSGKYRGKADTHPWQGGSQKFAGAQFKPGDKASWETAVTNRTQGQNEYVRIQ